MKHVAVKILLPIVLFTCAARLLSAQNDTSLLLLPERLTERDIVMRDLSLQSTKLISATRSLEEADQMPFSTWVVTAEDIQRNGFVTLGDVMRAAPGVRVSQPGNAEEGETFLMRGLAGNQFVKILINDVPVKPFAALGMPIGAQLPIRQAERIEVVYGPSGALYGNEACAGVVNIILKESERPVYTQADLSFGRFGSNNLDLTFGGKLGKDKKIFRFSLYGSSTVRERTDVYYDQSLFNMDTYVPEYMQSGYYWNLPNYRRSDAFNIPKTAPLMHESRMFGLNLKFRRMQFGYLRMGRFDHSALGLNPLAISYANSSNRIAETEEVYTLSFGRQRKRWTSFNNVVVTRYKVNNTSTTTLLYDRLAAGAYLLLAQQQPSVAGWLDTVYQRYNADERFGYANGIDIRYEFRVNAALGRRLSMDLGVQSITQNGIGYFNHHKTPVEAQVFDPSINSDPVALSASGTGELQLTSQLKWQDKNLTIIGAWGANLHVGYYLSARSLPRIAAQYRFLKHWTVRGNYATGLRHVSPYYRSNTFYVYSDNQGQLQRINDLELDYPELTRAAEGSIRFDKDIRLEGTFFWQETSNMIRPNQFAERPDIAPLYGYQQIRGVGKRIWGIQGLLRSEDVDLIELSNLETRKKNVVSSRLEFYLQYARGKEWLPELAEPLDEVMNQPRWHTQFRTFFRINKLELMFASNRQTSVLSKSVAYRDAFYLRFTQERYPTFRSWDMSARLFLSKQFLVYLYVQNMFNRHFAGLDATGTPDDLHFNPQQGRFFRFGMNYNLN